MRDLGTAPTLRHSNNDDLLATVVMSRQAIRKTTATAYDNGWHRGYQLGMLIGITLGALAVVWGAILQ